MNTARHLRECRSFSLLFVSVSPLLLLIPVSTLATLSHQSHPTAVKSAGSPPPGFYFEVMPCPRCYRCRPCPLNAGWQVKMMRILGASGVSSFPGEASGLEKANEEFGLVTSIKRFAKPVNYDTNIYVGPFDNDRAAIAAIPDLCAALNEVEVLESYCDQMTSKREGSTFYTRGSFDVFGVHLLPK